MSQAYADTPAAGWVSAVAQRRKALMQRLGMGAGVALVFSPVFGWSTGLAWVAGYYLIQFLEMWVFGPWTTGRRDAPPGLARAALGGLILLSNAVYFGSLSLMLWSAGGVMGGVCAAILLSSGVVYAVLNSPGSRVVLALTVSPQLLYLALTPFMMASHGAGPAFVVPVTLAIAIFVAFCLTSYMRMEKAAVERGAALREADRKRLDAEAAVESRGAFLATVGHDLRTPISAILAGAAELERTAVDSPARNHARMIGDAGLMMKALLDDLLDHAKLEAGRMTVEVADFNLRSLIAQTIWLWQGPARAGGLKLRVENSAVLPAAVRGDAMRLRQILNNLISNAMKFTEQGSITLRFAAWEEEPAGHAVIIEVIDTGPGMDAERLRRLFTPFDQGEGISARFGGTGLGLTISRHLAELMGGRLTARSVLGEGATFTLALSFDRADGEVAAASIRLDETGRGAVATALSTKPLPIRSVAPPTVEAEPAPAAAMETTASCDAAANADERPLRVLVVDDHDINRRAIELVLQPLGCETASAENGLKALELCAAETFDLIFMDVRMPELDGRETTRRLRALGGRNAATPVIAVTADTAPEDIAACNAAGMTYFVPKPISPASLLGAVQHALSAIEAEPETAAA